MPRTKVTRAKPKTKHVVNEQDDADVLKAMLEIVIEEKQRDIQVQKDLMNKVIETSRQQCNELKLKIPFKVLKRTCEELQNEIFEETPSSITINSDHTHILNMTRTHGNKMRRSASFTDDGYTTAENESSGTSGARQSRARSKLPKASKTSRSLSRTATQKKLNAFKTPSYKQQPAAIGTITPKCKPNTPQVILRRPKQGEVALSYQGSPLLTGPIIVENTANINIPLPDGNLMSLQPCKGLRQSQIPEMSTPTRRQLEVLRDNLIKVCAVIKDH